MRDAQHKIDPPQDGHAGNVSAPSSTLLVLGLEVAWVAGPDGERHRLGYGTRGMLQALVKRHQEMPWSCLSIYDLLASGWPGERVTVEAGTNRVHVALTHLRRRGLRTLIEHCNDGYRLVPELAIRYELPSHCCCDVR